MMNSLKRILSGFSFVAPFGLFLIAFINLVICFFCYRSTKPQFHYKLFVVTNYIHSVVTQVTSVSSSFVRPQSGNVNIQNNNYNLPKIIPVTYDYFVVGGSPVIKFFGKNYTEGDFCSRGMILRIFPDRIFLMDGTILENSRFTDNRPVIRPQMKGDKNDRRSTL